MIEQFDLFLFSFLEKIHSPLLDQIMRLFTSLGDLAIIWFGFMLFFLIIKKDRKQALVMFISVLLTSLCCDLILKNMIQRPRPFTTHPSLQPLITPPSSYSCPSGHTATSFAACTSIRGYKLIKKITFLFALLIAFSRVYLRVHYPSDVFAGIILGLLISTLVHYIFNKSHHLNKFLISKSE